jgi:hypothetical protein
MDFSYYDLTFVLDNDADEDADAKFAAASRAFRRTFDVSANERLVNCKSLFL